MVTDDGFSVTAYRDKPRGLPPNWFGACLEQHKPRYLDQSHRAEEFTLLAQVRAGHQQFGPARLALVGQAGRLVRIAAGVGMRCVVRLAAAAV